MRRTMPLIPIDTGWLFVLSGLALLAAAVLLPPQRQLFVLRQDLEMMQTKERLSMTRLRAYSDFLSALETGDPALTRRLVSAHLNLIREGDRPLLIAESASAPITSWIEDTITPEPITPRHYHETHLTWLVEGAWRHWIVGGSILCLFAGLMVGQTRNRTSR